MKYLLNNKQINPQKLKLPEARKLENEELENFNKIKKILLKKL